MLKYKRVAIDFDGTLVEDSTNIEVDYLDNKMLIALNGAAEATQYLKSLGFEILIFTCRPDYHRKYMEWIMAEQSIEHDYILFYTKPRVDLYIDNKGYRFENWKNTKDFIESQL